MAVTLDSANRILSDLKIRLYTDIDSLKNLLEKAILAFHVLMNIVEWILIKVP